VPARFALTPADAVAPSNQQLQAAVRYIYIYNIYIILYYINVKKGDRAMHYISLARRGSGPGP